MVSKVPPKTEPVEGLTFVTVEDVWKEMAAVERRPYGFPFPSVAWEATAK